MALTLLVGSLLGLLSGFFGLGGSSIATPLLRDVLGMDPLLALGTPLPVTVPAAGLACWTYARAGLVNWRVGLWTLAAALPTAIAGSLVSELVSGHELMVLTGALVAAVGAAFAAQPALRRRRAGSPTERLARPAQPGPILLIGGSVGFLSGLLANGGGVLLVPAYIVFLRLATKEAFGTSLMVVVGTALPSSVVHATLGHVDFARVPWLAMTMVPMAWVGARLALVVAPHRIRQAYGLAMVALAVIFVTSELRSL